MKNVKTVFSGKMKSLNEKCENCIFWENEEFKNSKDFGECGYIVDTMDDDDVSDNMVYSVSTEYSRLITHKEFCCNQFTEK
jgi:hypothetical protein